MPQIIEVPGMGEVEFPDDMSDDQIASAIKANMQPAAPRPMENGMPVFPDLPGEGERPDSPKPSAFRSVTDWLSNVGNAFTAPRAQQWTDKVPLLGPAYGATEAATSLVTGIVDPITAPLFAGGKVGGGTYQPRSGYGRQILGTLGAAMAPATESGAADVLGAMAPELGALRRPPVPLSARQAIKQTPMLPVPATAELKAAANDLYNASERSGAVISPESFQSAVARMEAELKKQSLAAERHPKSNSMLRTLQERAAENRPMTLKEADQWRQVIRRDAVNSGDSADRTIGRELLENFDDYIDSLSGKDVIAGNAEQAVSFLRGAQDTWRRKANSEMLDDILSNAELDAAGKYSQAGIEQALRAEFKRLAKNERRMRGFSEKERTAIEAVVRGGSLSNFTREISKIAPSGGLSKMLTIMHASVNPKMAAVQTAAGIAAKKMSEKQTLRAVDQARETLVGRGLRMPNINVPAATSAAVSGELMQRPPLALPAPNIVAGTRSAPGTAYAREQMGLTPDVEKAGALHPGMARESAPPPAPALPYRPAETPPMTVDSQGRAAMSPDQLAAFMRNLEMERVRQSHPGAPRTSPSPQPLALPLLQRRPMVVDSQGRAAANPSQIDAYMRELGMNNMRNVRQPRAEPMQGLLGGEPEQTGGLLGRSTRSAGQIRQDLQRLDEKIQRLPVGEPLTSPRMKALAAEWERLRAELSAAESSGASP